MSESICQNNELENKVSSDMSYFWYSEVTIHLVADKLNVTCRVV